MVLQYMFDVVDGNMSFIYGILDLLKEKRHQGQKAPSGSQKAEGSKGRRVSPIIVTLLGLTIKHALSAGVSSHFLKWLTLASVLRRLHPCIMM